jgi:hypothetical protein
VFYDSHSGTIIVINALCCCAQRLDEFMAGFSVITMQLKEMYQMITLGGDAELELVDSLDPFSEGIVFRYACMPSQACVVRPPYMYCVQIYVCMCYVYMYVCMYTYIHTNAHTSDIHIRTYI